MQKQSIDGMKQGFSLIVVMWLTASLLIFFSNLFFITHLSAEIGHDLIVRHQHHCAAQALLDYGVSLAMTHFDLVLDHKKINTLHFDHWPLYETETIQATLMLIPEQDKIRVTSTLNFGQRTLGISCAVLRNKKDQRYVLGEWHST